MTKFQHAEWLWVGGIVVLLAYELFALATDSETLSRAIWTADRTPYGPFIPFAVGFLCGHLFWSGN